MLKTKYLLPLILILFLTFTLICDCTDWLPGWDYRIECSIEDYANDIGGEVVWFPATIFLTSTQGEEIFVELTTDGEYLKTQITESDGTTKLYGQKELFDVSEEKGIFHVSRDGWTINSNDSVFIYYDKDHADNTDWIGVIGSVPAEKVYDSNTKLAYKMNSASDAQLIDSTDQDNDSTSNTLDTGVGKIGLCMHGDGNLEIAQIGDFDDVGNSGKELTVSAWVNGAEQISKAIVSHYGTNQWTWVMATGIVDNESKLQVTLVEKVDWSGGYKAYRTSITAFDESWHQIAFSWNNGTLELYVDGVKDGSVVKVVDNAFTTLENPACDILLAADRPSSPQNMFGGTIDEVTISNNVRSDAWMKGLFNSGDGALFTYGSEEEAPVVTNVMFMFSDF